MFQAGDEVSVPLPGDERWTVVDTIYRGEDPDREEELRFGTRSAYEAWREGDAVCLVSRTSHDDVVVFSPGELKLVRRL